MPTYDFECPHCHTCASFVCPMSERDQQSCEVCGARLVRKPSAPGFSIGGFNYKNGYSNTGPNKEDK